MAAWTLLFIRSADLVTAGAASSCCKAGNGFDVRPPEYGCFLHDLDCSRSSGYSAEGFHSMSPNRLRDVSQNLRRGFGPVWPVCCPALLVAVRAGFHSIIWT
jgi:hypothetical protein